MATFICHLYTSNYAPTTILTYCSALSFVNKLFGAPDPSQNFLIKKLIEGAKKLGPSTDTRLPITLNTLHRLINALQTSQTNHYNRKMLSAMYLLCFHALLRIGEITVRSHSADTSTTLQAKDCIVHIKGALVQSIDITIRNGKHSKGQAFTINIPANGTQFCPAQALHQYLLLAKPTQGPLFQFPGGTPVTRSYFNTQLHATLCAANINPTYYKGHSFRIGAATEAVGSLGLSEHQVQKLGRWSSTAFKSYIRIPQFTIKHKQN